jgi:SAM-dependent methyltransferase
MSEVFYDATYFESHYGRFLPEDAYYQLKALFWRKAITELWPLHEPVTILDYGSGLGQVTAAFSDCHCYDLAEFSRSFLLARGRTVYAHFNEIPKKHFDVILSSHSLEHTADPYEQLQRFASYAKERGTIILILPIERDKRRHLNVDNNNHLFAWTFQTITNLLIAAGWEPCFQHLICDSFFLKRLGRFLKTDLAVIWGLRLGKWFRSYPAMFIVARKRSAAQIQPATGD